MIPRLAARGAVDFAGADLLDAKFWIRLRMAEKAILDDDEFHLREMEFNRELTYMQIAAANKGDNTGTFSDRADGSLAAAWSIRFPWVKTPKREDLLWSMESEWARTWGDPNDPAVQKKIEAACEELRRQRLKARE